MNPTIQVRTPQRVLAEFDSVELAAELFKNLVEQGTEPALQIVQIPTCSKCLCDRTSALQQQITKITEQRDRALNELERYRNCVAAQGIGGLL
jgi:hypothetical protein